MLNSCAAPIRQCWWNGRGVRALVADDRWFQVLQCLFKLPALIGLIKPRVEQDEAAVTQRKDADGQKKVSIATEKPTGHPHICSPAVSRVNTEDCCVLS